MFKTGSRVMLLNRRYLGVGSVIKQEDGSVEVLWDNEKKSIVYKQEQLDFYTNFTSHKIVKVESNENTPKS